MKNNNFFLKTKTINGSQPKLLVGGVNKPTIDLISISIINGNADDKIIKKDVSNYNIQSYYSSVYYAISKDFNLNLAWDTDDIRDNILKPIFDFLIKFEANEAVINNEKDFCYKNVKYLINKYGKSNKEIKEDITKFIMFNIENNENVTSFYSRDCAYDKVIFDWLFDSSIKEDRCNKLFKYCKELLQEEDRLLQIINHKAKCRNEKTYTTLNNVDGFPNYDIRNISLFDVYYIYEIYEFVSNY